MRQRITHEKVCSSNNYRPSQKEIDKARALKKSESSKYYIKVFGRYVPITEAEAKLYIGITDIYYGKV